MSTSSPDCRIWSAGLPRAGGRPLHAPEVGELRELAGQFQRKGLSALAAIPLLLAGLLGLAAALGWTTPGRLSPVLILLTVGLPLLALVARDCLVLAGEIRRDIAAGSTSRFEGEVGRVIGYDGTLARLLRSGLLRKGSSETQWFEILPVSGLVWCANGIRPRRWIRAACAETAPLPSYAGVAAEWVETVDASREDAFHVGKRELSREELAELDRHVRRMLMKPLLSALLLNGWLLAAVWALAAGRAHLDTGHTMFLFSVLVVVTAQVDLRLFHCLKLLHKLRRDGRLRLAVIVRSPALLRQDPSAPTLLPPDEFLAVSGVLWTRAGAPAPWRLAPVP